MKILTDKSLMTDYIHDESKKISDADAIFFPESEEEIIALLKSDPLSEVTAQGSRTGLTAGCLPSDTDGSDKQVIISLSRMKNILSIDDDNMTVTVQPGLTLMELRQFLAKKKYFYPTDPTETSASVGGMISCNSSGARSYKYGAMRSHVDGIRVVLRSGDVLSLSRGENFAKALDFSLTTTEGRTISGRLPELNMPDVKKHTAGYYIKPDMDLIDLFIGSEGSLGIVSEARLKLLRAPEIIWGALIFFDSEEKAVEFVHLIRRAMPSEAENKPEALEFFGCDTLDLLRAAQRNHTALEDVMPISDDYGCAIYIEHIGDSRNELMDIYRTVSDLIIRAGGSPDDSWLATGGPVLKKLKDFRHAAPVCVNREIAGIKKTYPEITKLGTDMSVPDSRLWEVYRMYRQDIARCGFRTAVFGHIGDNHLHVNIIPQNSEQYLAGKDLYRNWAKKIASMGGSVSAEHGIGKLKTWLLEELYSPEEIDEMRKLKAVFDPDFRLGAGTLFSPLK